MLVPLSNMQYPGHGGSQQASVPGGRLLCEEATELTKMDTTARPMRMPKTAALTMEVTRWLSMVES